MTMWDAQCLGVYGVAYLCTSFSYYEHFETSISDIAVYNSNQDIYIKNG